MSQLTQEHIAFIDRYLENSDVIYADIRMEMVDHVASDIENQMSNGDDRTFDEIFKDYMLKNKLRLLDSKRSTVKQITKDLVRSTIKRVFTPAYLGGLLFLTLIYYLAILQFGIKTATWIHLGLNFLLFFGALSIYEIYRKRHNVGRFSGIERLGIIVTVLVQLVFLMQNLSHVFTETFHWLYSVIFSFQFIVSIAILQLGIEQFRIYKQNFLKA